MPRTEKPEGVVSTLPYWIITEVPKKGAKGVIGITCPRKDCGGKAIVNEQKWVDSRPGFIGRSCTYCFRTNRIPES